MTLEGLRLLVRNATQSDADNSPAEFEIGCFVLTEP